MNPLKNEDGIVYVTVDGKTYKLQSVLRQRERNARCDEVREEQTRRRLWWRTHVVSRDMPDSKAARADLSDNGKGARFLAALLDGETPRPLPCIVAKRNALRIARRTMTPYAKVARFVAAVYANREEGRSLTMRQFGIGQSTYYWRLERYARILGYGGAC